jgi:pro-apoptotic serine protease NMA111
MFSSCICWGSNGDPWPAVLDRASQAVVMLKIQSIRSFESNSPGISISSGFVVDRKLGIILTNRHVVQAGPIVGKASFINNEEVQISALYRDPEHDFGFLKYDPKALKHMVAEELELYPEGAKIGVSDVVATVARLN